jgi:predicted RNA methylase
MKSERMNPGRELYRQMRALSWRELWDQEVDRFNRAGPQERGERVGVIRAVGVVFSDSGAPEERETVRIWLRQLLQDPSEKIRRYAIAALPKIGAGLGEEAEFLTLLRTTQLDREKKFLGKALEKIGGKATLEHISKEAPGSRIEQKIKANLADSENPSDIRMDRSFSDYSGLKIHLRGRRGLEGIVRDEIEESIRNGSKFRIAEVREGLATIIPTAPFALQDIFRFRCFGTVGFEVGSAEKLEDLPSAIVSRISRRLLETFTSGSIRYRLDFPSKGHQRGAVKYLANQVYALCPTLLNSAQNAAWTISIHFRRGKFRVEISPKQTADPRFYYRMGDVPAASHPPLAACMARLSGGRKQEVVWDPFCGSGLELIERALLGGVRCIYGTDRSPEAISITEKNFAAANIPFVQTKFICCDFRDFAKVEKLAVNSVTLVISNPPMGKRIHIPNLKGLMDDFLAAAVAVLKVGGRLVFANPLRTHLHHPSLKLEFQTVVDFGGFDCRLEMYAKVARYPKTDKAGPLRKTAAVSSSF